MNLDKLQLALNRRFNESVVRDPGALRYMLNSSAEAEANGEGTVFKAVLPFLEGKIAKLVEAHSADEVRHEKMLLDALYGAGGTKEPVPEERQMVTQMGKAAGNIFDRPIQGKEDVAKAYLLLYAIERRAIKRFTLMEEALRPVQPAIADVFASITRDERRHLLYCVAVSRSVVPDDATWTRMRDEMVAIETDVFTEQSRRFMYHLLDDVFTTVPWYQRLMWKAVRSLADLLGQKMTVLPIGGAQELPSPVRGALTQAA